MIYISRRTEHDASREAFTPPGLHLIAAKYRREAERLQRKAVSSSIAPQFQDIARQYEQLATTVEGMWWVEARRR